MVAEVAVATWEEFAERAESLRVSQKTQVSPSLPLLFRGQRDSSWSLSTSLERYRPEAMRFEDYYRVAMIVRPQTEVFTGREWTVPEFPEIMKLAQSYNPLSTELWAGRLPGYEYLAHLRHNGFPSPLLDWTESPFVAAFFAFRHPPSGSHVSIHALAESKMKTSSNLVPTVHHFGPIVRTHRRHFLQQSSYTICVAHDRDNGWAFVPHETPMALGGDDKPNFTLTKFRIPASERIRVLAMLDDYNLNAYSLFGSEESLMETLALREFLLRARG